jgi:hypothetical protein
MIIDLEDSWRNDPLKGRWSEILNHFRIDGEFEKFDEPFYSWLNVSHQIKVHYRLDNSIKFPVLSKLEMPDQVYSMLLLKFL